MINGPLGNNRIRQGAVCGIGQGVGRQLLRQDGVVFIHKEIGEGGVQSRGLDGHAVIRGIHRAHVFIDEGIAKGVVNTVVVEMRLVGIIIDDILNNRVVNALKEMNNVLLDVDCGVCVRDVDCNVIPCGMDAIRGRVRVHNEFL